MVDVLTERKEGFQYLVSKYGDAGAREVFEGLCAKLLNKMYGPSSHQIRVSQGDGGVDILVEDGAESVRVFQCKFFPKSIGDSQQEQIRRSFTTVTENSDLFPTVKEWILCLPLILSEAERNWWNKWKTKQETKHKVSIDLWDSTHLIGLLQKYDLYNAAFDIKLSSTLEEILQTLTELAHIRGMVASAKEKIAPIATILDADVIAQAEAACSDTDAENFYLVDTNFQTMLRVVSAGRDDPCTDLDSQLWQLCQKNLPVILTGHGGAGKSTALLRTAVAWARSGQLALWVSFSGNRAITDAEAEQFYRSLLQIIPAGQRVLLCLDNPAEDSADDAEKPMPFFQALKNHWPGDSRIQLLMTERKNRLSRITGGGNDHLYHWFDGATVLVMQEEDPKHPFRLRDYPVEYFSDPFFRRKAILEKAVRVLGKRGNIPEGFRKDAVLNVLRLRNSPTVSLVELIYRTKFELLEHAAKDSSLRMDWDEWAYMLKRELKIKKSAKQLYGIIALCSFYEIPITTDLFCRFFGLEMLDFGELISNWKMNRHVEPVIYSEQDKTLRPKHDIVAELFFLFHREFMHNDMMLSLLERMTVREVEIFLARNVRKWIVQKGDRFPLREIHWRDYFSTICERNQNRSCTLSAGGLCSLGLGLIYTVPQKGDSSWAKDVLSNVDNLAPSVTSHPLAAALYTEWGRLLQSRGNAELAEKKFRLVAAHYPQHIHSRTELGKLLAKLGRDEQAEVFLLEILTIKPNDIPTRTELGKLLAKQGRNREAETVLWEILDIDPRNIQARTELGKLLAKQDRDGEAEVFLREAIRIDPKNIHSRIELGKLLAKQDRDGEAEVFLREAIRIDSKNIHSRTELGKLLTKLGRDEEAEVFLREILDIKPNDIQARTELGKLLAKQGKDGEAEVFLREAIRIDPKNLHPHTVLADLCLGQGRIPEAKALYEAVLKLDPQNVYAKAGLRKLPQEV